MKSKLSCLDVEYNNGDTTPANTQVHDWLAWQMRPFHFQSSLYMWARVAQACGVNPIKESQNSWAVAELRNSLLQWFETARTHCFIMASAWPKVEGYSTMLQRWMISYKYIPIRSTPWLPISCEEISIIVYNLIPHDPCQRRNYVQYLLVLLGNW